MCPEQARGDEMDGRGDLYSVGVILYELLAGRLPFAGRSTMDLLLAHVTEEPPPLSTANLDIAPSIEEVVRLCLAKHPDDRPRSARELSELYEAALSSEMAGRPLTPVAPSELSPQAAGSTTPSASNLERPGEASLGRDERTKAVPVSPLAPLADADKPELDDPFAVIHRLQAWMPERIAEYKLRGFIHDVGGEMIESVPGRIHVRFGGRGSVYTAPRQGLSWLGIGRSCAIDMELRLQHADAARGSQLRITVVFRSSGTDLNANMAWRNVCTQIFCDLRGYLMGQTGTVSAATE
jgi:hypothetical protein